MDVQSWPALYLAALLTGVLVADAGTARLRQPVRPVAVQVALAAAAPVRTLFWVGAPVINAAHVRAADGIQMSDLCAGWNTLLHGSRRDVNQEDISALWAGAPLWGHSQFAVFRFAALPGTQRGLPLVRHGWTLHANTRRAVTCLRTVVTRAVRVTNGARMQIERRTTDLALSVLAFATTLQKAGARTVDASLFGVRPYAAHELVAADLTGSRDHLALLVRDSLARFVIHGRKYTRNIGITQEDSAPWP